MGSGRVGSPDKVVYSRRTGSIRVHDDGVQTATTGNYLEIPTLVLFVFDEKYSASCGIYRLGREREK